MRAVRLLETDSLPQVVQCPTPAPAAHEVQIAVAACGLNFADLLMMSGKYQDTPATPFTMGMEVAGIVTALGQNVQGFAIGQRVAAFTGQGGLADTVTCDAARCVALPDSISLQDAAGFLIAYGTSHLALTHRARLAQGETLVVLGAAGGVGLTAVEIGAALGARVIAVARGDEKLEIARRAGAEICIDARSDGLRDQIKAHGGADVIYDAIGEPLATAALRALRPDGRFLAIGFAGGDVPKFPANILLVKNLTVIGLYWGGYLGFAPQILTQSLSDLFAMHSAGRLRPHISHVLPLSEVLTGFELLRQRKSTGKIVIEVQPEQDLNKVLRD